MKSSVDTIRYRYKSVPSEFRVDLQDGVIVCPLGRVAALTGLLRAHLRNHTRLMAAKDLIN